MKIPYAIILNIMLEALGLPLPHYEEKVHPNEKVCVPVTFNTSLLLFEGALVPKSIYGIISVDADEAEHSAAIEAIRYVEDSCDTKIRDYNYNEVKRLQQENSRLKKKIWSWRMIAEKGLASCSYADEVLFTAGAECHVSLSFTWQLRQRFPDERCP